MHKSLLPIIRVRSYLLYFNLWHRHYYLLFLNLFLLLLCCFLLHFLRTLNHMTDWIFSNFLASRLLLWLWLLFLLESYAAFGNHFIDELFENDIDFCVGVLRDCTFHHRRFVPVDFK